MQFTGSGATFISTGSVTGGTGGGLGVGASGNGPAGPGGVAIVGSNLTVINSGSITGGMSGSTFGLAPVTQANAITFTGGANVLQLQAGSSISGNVVAGGSSTLQLGGTANASFNVSAIGPAAQYQGFSAFQKIGAGTWTLSGTTAAKTNWTINGGVLAVSNDVNLGATGGSLAFGGGALQFGPGFSSARAIVLNAGGGTFDTNGFAANLSGTIGGAGSFTKAGAGTLFLSGANIYSGGTTITGGLINFSAAEQFRQRPRSR